MRIRKYRPPGNVLLTMLVIIGLVSLVAGSYISLTGAQHSLTVRSQAWGSCIPIAEAGVEEALAHLNSGPTNLAANGWALSGGQYWKKRTIGDGYFYTTITNPLQPVIVSLGFTRIPSQTNYLSRAVLVTTKFNQIGFGILAKNTILMSGGASMDSFNSADPLYSTGGKYDPAKARANANVGSLAPVAKAIDTGTGKIYGNVATPPGGTAIGTVGDPAWNDDSANKGKIQPGHSRDDLNVSVPDVQPPFTNGYFTPGSGTVNGTNYLYALGSADYLMSSCTIPGGKAMVINGKARLYVTGSFTTSGSGYIYITPGASLELYVGGPSLTISGNGVVNGAQNAASCAIYGLPTLTSGTYSGSAAYIGTVYTPQAAFTFSGGQGLFGAVVGKTFNASGSAGLHYDEALGGNGTRCQVTSWVEL